MSIGKSKQGSKGKKGLKKKIVDPFSRKEWYDIKAPSIFTKKQVGKTLVNRSQGLKNADDSLKGRIYEVSLGDLNNDEENAFKKIKLRCEDVVGKNCLTTFYGLDFTTDKMRSLVKKWHTMITAHLDVKTTDGYLLRLFCVGFTFRKKGQIKKASYAQGSKVRGIRKKMFEIMARESTSCDLKELVQKLIPEAIGLEIQKACRRIHPIENCYIRKVKLLKAPKMDRAMLKAIHGDFKGDMGSKVTRGDFVEPAVLDSV